MKTYFFNAEAGNDISWGVLDLDPKSINTDEGWKELKLVIGNSFNPPKKKFNLVSLSAL